VFLHHSRRWLTVRFFVYEVSKRLRLSQPAPAIRHEMVYPHGGFLFDEGDAAGMAERMLRLADDPALRLAMGRRGRQLIEDLGNVECNVRRLEMLLKSACRPALAAG